MADLYGFKLPDTVSEILGFPTSKQAWRLKMLDPPETEFVGQYVGQDATENIGANLSSVSATGAKKPTHQFQSGGEETFTFTARIFAEFSFQNIQKKVIELKSFAKKRDDLKRPPIFTFSYGTELSFKCFLASPGGIRYDEPRLDGSLRGATFSMNLIILDDLDLDPTKRSLVSKIKDVVGIVSSVAGLASRVGFIDLPGGSLKKTGRIHTVKDADTFETIAGVEYGSALHGDILRRAHPELRILMAGDKVQLLDKDDVLATNVTQQSVMLADNVDAAAVRSEFFEKRGESKTIFI